MQGLEPEAIETGIILACHPAAERTAWYTLFFAESETPGFRAFGNFGILSV